MPPARNKPAESKASVRLWLSWILLAAGVLCLTLWAASQVAPMVWQAWANRQLDRAIRNAPPAASQGAPPGALETGHLIGRLSIPRLHLTDVVREGDDETTLSLALGHIPGTALPGQKGNVGVAGHRDSLFRPLREIHKDDVIRFETVSGTREYRVDSTSIVKPQDVSVLDPKPAPSLTLVTCYPFYYVGAAPERFIVSAHEVLQPEAVQAQVQSAPAVAPLRPVVLKTASQVAPAATPSAVSFEISKGAAREIAPGISLGISDVDPGTSSVYGWIWLKEEGRSVILRAQPTGTPLVFYQEGHRRELRFTGVSGGTATGHLTLAEN